MLPHVPRVLRLSGVPLARETEIDRLLERFSRGLGLSAARPAALEPRIDLIETPTELRVSAELPGLGEADLEVELEDGVLMLRGERHDDRGEHGAEARYHRMEGFRGRFERAIALPAEIDADAVEAVYRRGVLTVTLPKLPDAGARDIPIH
jgi:HSP20 family protein